MTSMLPNPMLNSHSHLTQSISSSDLPDHSAFRTLLTPRAFYSTPSFFIPKYGYLQGFSFSPLSFFSPHSHSTPMVDLIYLMFPNTFFTMMTACDLMTLIFISPALTSPLKTKLINSTAYLTSLLDVYYTSKI